MDELSSEAKDSSPRRDETPLSGLGITASPTQAMYTSPLRPGVPYGSGASGSVRGGDLRTQDSELQHSPSPAPQNVERLVELIQDLDALVHAPSLTSMQTSTTMPMR